MLHQTLGGRGDLHGPPESGSQMLPKGKRGTVSLRFRQLQFGGKELEIEFVSARYDVNLCLVLYPVLEGLTNIWVECQ